MMHRLSAAVLALILPLLAPSAVWSQQSTTPEAKPGATSPAQPVPAAPSSDSTAREVVLEPRPVLILRGEATWDDGYEALLKSFNTLRTEAGRLGLTVVDRPLAAFQETDETKFKYDAMVFLDKEPPAETKPQGGISVGKSLAGKAYVFKHVGAYDDIDTVYEAITAWLDDKGLTARGAFIEEYLNEPTGADDTKLELQIYVFVQ